MLQLHVIYGPTFTGSVDMLKITAQRIAKIVLGSAHGGRKITTKQISISSSRATARTLSVNDVMFVIAAEPDLANANVLEAARIQLKDVFDEAVKQVHPELRFVTQLTFDLERATYARRPSPNYPFMDSVAQHQLEMEVQHLRDLLRKPA